MANIYSSRYFATVTFLLALLAGAVSAQAQESESAKDGEDFVFEASSNEFRAPTGVEPVADGLYTFRWGAARSLFMITDDGVIVTDPLNLKAARSLRDAIAKMTDQPVKYVVYSHSHKDRAAGAQIFKDEGAQIVAQEKCADNIKETPYPGVLPPDITFSDHYTIELGGRALELFYFGPSHDNCLITMWSRHASALYLVSLVQPPTGWSQPWDPMGADFYFNNIVHYLKSVEDLAQREEIDWIVGGWISVGLDENGKKFLQPPHGTMTALTEAREFWELVMAEVKAEVDKGTFVTQVADRMDLTPFESLSRYNEEHFKLFIRRVATYYTTGW